VTTQNPEHLSMSDHCFGCLPMLIEVAARQRECARIEGWKRFANEGVLRKPRPRPPPTRSIHSCNRSAVSSSNGSNPMRPWSMRTTSFVAIACNVPVRNWYLRRGSV